MCWLLGWFFFSVRAIPLLIKSGFLSPFFQRQIKKQKQKMVGFWVTLSLHLRPIAQHLTLLSLGGDDGMAMQEGKLIRNALRSNILEVRRLHA